MPRRWMVSGAALLLLGACESREAKDEAAGPGTGTFEEVFEEVRRVALEESVVATVGVVTNLLPLDDRLLLPDRMSGRVLAFSYDGRLIGSVGRIGDGPGEFRRPDDIVQDVDGSVLLTDGTHRITRMSPDLDILETYTLDVPNFVAGLTRLGDRVAVHLFDNRSQGYNFVFWSPENGMEESFDPRSPLVIEVPYWNATFATRIAGTSEWVFAADNMVYPFRRYSATLDAVDSVGRAPSSWMQARRPERGEFSLGVGPSAIVEWRTSFTTIDRMEVLDDRYLLVSHRRRVNQYATDDEFRLDIYDTRSNMRKVWEDVPLPGPIVGGGRCAWVVVAKPPGPWTLGCYRLREK